VFAVLLTEAASAGEIVELAQRILASVAAEPFRAADRSVVLSASVGVALADGSPAGYVWRNADAAVSRAKESGGGRLEVFPAMPHRDARRHLSLAAQLGRALGPGQPSRNQHGEAELAAAQPGEAEPGEAHSGQAHSGPARSSEARSGEDGSGPAQPGRAQLVLEYRPIADLASSRIIGAEAVPRWRGDWGDVPCQEFLAAAETARVSVELGDWMLRECCSQLAGWRQDGWEASLGLHCPAAALMAPFGASVLEALADSGLAPAALILEVPPEVWGRAVTPSCAGWVSCAMGVRLAVDISRCWAGRWSGSATIPDLVRSARPGGRPWADAGRDPDRALVQIGKDLGIPVAADGIERRAAIAGGHGLRPGMRSGPGFSPASRPGAGQGPGLTGSGRRAQPGRRGAAVRRRHLACLSSRQLRRMRGQFDGSPGLGQSDTRVR
jgi:EAL domain-containing protein (putative c-di-GMP-specific phosphodiesterase class I)